MRRINALILTSVQSLEGESKAIKYRFKRRMIALIDLYKERKVDYSIKKVFRIYGTYTLSS